MEASSHWTADPQTLFKVDETPEVPVVLPAKMAEVAEMRGPVQDEREESSLRVVKKDPQVDEIPAGINVCLKEKVLCGQYRNVSAGKKGVMRSEVVRIENRRRSTQHHSSKTKEGLVIAKSSIYAGNEGERRFSKH